MIVNPDRKRILLISSYFYPEPTGVGKYNGEMIDYLARKGYVCSVVVPYPYYPFWRIQEPYRKNSLWYSTETKISQGTVPIKIYRCPQFVPKKPTGLKRMIQDLTFLVSATFRVFSILSHKKYDYVIGVAPSFTVGVAAMLYKKLTGAKFLYHIQDLQIDAARDLGMIRSRHVVNTLLALEKSIIQNADTVSSISPGMIRRIAKKVNRGIISFPNWVDTENYFKVANRNSLKVEFGFKSSDKVILYSGSIGEKQGLEDILTVADQLRTRQDLKFVICGSGPYKFSLQTMKEQLGLDNVIFVPLQPTENLNRFLNIADIHLVLQKKGASDLVMPSKLTTILAVGGVAIIATSIDSSLYEMTKSFDIGILTSPEDPQALAAVIDSLDDYDLEKISNNARGYAVQFLSIEKVFELMPSILQ